MDTLKIATFNVNGIQTRLAALLAWLEREAPDIVCLQELKTPDARFPAAALEKAGYGAIWQGQSAWNGVAILARDSQPLEVRRGLPGNASDPHSRYLEAAVDGLLVASLYLPNGNPQPGPKFDYKLAWFEHLIRHAAELMESGHPVVLAGDFNVVPSDFDIYDTRSWKKDALLQPESRECFERQHWQRDAGLRIDHLLLSASLADHLEDAGVDRWVRGEEHASDHALAWVSLRRPSEPRR
ncbi:exodeoxyribonuclease III [Pseudomonas aeruginosa]|uniref:exodeoxyribonuclease III n=1 Tax=Pseudomonas aeruginosa TaxID=287 RepID=UPI0021E13A4C|nr:exodeoxyribonuclease III [Pseudomonas aeruginosa]MCV0285700.1 exodeoxyribonuclease III [Pseudomonas aeruginosa]